MEPDPERMEGAQQTAPAMPSGPSAPVGHGADGEATGSLAAALGHAQRLVGLQPDLAAAQAREILIHAPGHPQAELILGRALRMTGEFQEANLVLGELARREPRSAATAFELGLTLIAQADRSAGIATLRQATALSPDFAQAWAALAKALRDAGQTDEALRADAGAVRAASKDQHLLQAAKAMGDHRFETAEQMLASRLKANPEDAAATRLMGELAWRRGRSDEAIRLVGRALDLAPGFVAAREFLARLLGQLNRLPEALEQASALCAMEPQDSNHAMLRASLLVRVGEAPTARAVYEELIQRNGAHPPLWLNLGNVYKTLGEQDLAVTAYRRAIALVPALGEAWWSLSNLKTTRFDEADLSAIRAAIASQPCEEDAFHLHFALGKALEDDGDAAGAFAAYDAANRLRRGSLPYNADVTHADAQAHAAAFSEDFLRTRRRDGGGCPTPDPIFIVGMPRSGSTLVEQILASHSQVEGTMELPTMMLIADRLSTRGSSEGATDLAVMVQGLSASQRTRLGEEYLESTRIYRKTDRPFFLDKMPNNWQNAGLIRLILPRARIVDVRRHPMACCFSGWKQHFARGQAFSYGLSDIGRYYADYVAQMTALDDSEPGAVRRMIYEQLVSDTEDEVRALLEWLDLPFEPSCLAFWQNRRAVRTASAEQVRRPIYQEGLNSWRPFSPFLGELRAALTPLLTTWPELPADWAADLRDN